MVKTYLQHKFGGYLLEAHAALNASMQRAHPTERKFILFGRGRSGSTLLQTMLGSHPDIQCQGEILRYRTMRPLAYAQNALSLSSQPVRGFKLLSYQLRDLCSPENQWRFHDWFKAEDITIFHLQRTNLFRHALSNLYARQRRAYHSTDKTAQAHAPVHMNVGELIKWMEGSKALLEYELKFLDDLDRHEIIYEKDLATPEAQTATYKNTVAALGLSPAPFEVTLKKVTPKDLAQIATNHDEIIRALTKTEYKEFLD